jgi:hypothetical protein
MNRQSPSLVERTVHRITVDSPRLTGRSTGWGRVEREREKRDEEGRLEAGSRSRPGAVVPAPEEEAAAPQAGQGDRLGGKGRGRGADDRRERTMEMMGESRASYMWTKRRGGAKPDGVKLNPNRQRTGSDSTTPIHVPTTLQTMFTNISLHFTASFNHPMLCLLYNTTLLIAFTLLPQAGQDRNMALTQLP